MERLLHDVYNGIVKLRDIPQKKLDKLHQHISGFFESVQDRIDEIEDELEDDQSSPEERETLDDEAVRLERILEINDEISDEQTRREVEIEEAADTLVSFKNNKRKGGMIGGMNPELKVAQIGVRNLQALVLNNLFNPPALNTLKPMYRSLMARFSEYFDEPEFYKIKDVLDQIREALGIAVGGSYIQPINQKPDYNFCCGGAITYEYPIKVRQITRDWNRAKDIWMRSSRQQADIDRATRNFDKKYEELFKELESKGAVVRPDPTDVDGFAIEILDEAAEEELRKYFEWLDNLEVEERRRISFAEGSGRHGGSYIQPVNAKFLPF